MDTTTQETNGTPATEPSSSSTDLLAEKLEEVCNWIKATAEPGPMPGTYRMGYLDKGSKIHKIVESVKTVESFR